MKTERLIASVLASLFVIGLVALCVHLATQGKQIVSLACAGFGLIVIVVFVWKFIISKHPEDQNGQKRTLTPWEVVGHVIMAAMIGGAFVVSVITDDWIWATFAFASLATSACFLILRRRRGEKLTLRDLIDALF